MHTVNLSNVSPDARAACAEIARKADVNLRDCYQCGKCSAGCPMSEDMDLPPRQVIRKLQLGLLDEALSASSPWLCAQCQVCSVRCPQGIDITGIMREVRRASKAAGKRSLPESDVFEDLFLKKVKKKGRSSEQYLAASYNMSSGHLMQDMGSAPKMLSKGLVGVKAQSVRDIDAVRKIFEKCEEGRDA